MNFFPLFRLISLGVVLLCMVTVTARGEPYNGTPFAVPGRFEAEEFDRGAESEAYHGEGAVVVATHQFESGGVATNVWEPLPRDRPDANIAVGPNMSGVLLGLRPKEWVKYSIAVETEGYYEICFATVGLAVPATGCFRPDEVRPGEGSYPSFSVMVDGRLVANVLASGRSTTGRTWLAAGLHELRLSCEWAPTYLYQCLWGANNIAYSFWHARTCPIDWIQIIPAAVPLRPAWDIPNSSQNCHQEGWWFGRSSAIGC